MYLIFMKLGHRSKKKKTVVDYLFSCGIVFIECFKSSKMRRKKKNKILMIQIVREKRNPIELVRIKMNCIDVENKRATSKKCQ